MSEAATTSPSGAPAADVSALSPEELDAFTSKDRKSTRLNSSHT